MSTPPATTATVPVSSAPRCAAASMPRARPETTTSPARPSPSARSRARRRPLAEALRAPTTATDRLVEQLGLAEHGQDRRRILDRGERARIERLAPADEPAADAVERGQARLRRRRGWPRSTVRGALAAAGQARQRFECRAGRAEAAQHRVKADRTDRFGAASGAASRAVPRVRARARPGRPQLFRNEIRLSLPAIRRRILA